jgi:hypothetical protein
MARLLRDARFAFRLFRRAPAFTSLAIAVLALGISSTTAIFSVVYGTFFAPLPYRDAEALVMVWSQFRGERVPVSAKDFVAWKREATAFSDLNASRRSTYPSGKPRGRARQWPYMQQGTR